MRIILLQDVESLGKKFEIKEVSGGYGRNFLLKNNLARIATKEDFSLAQKKQEKEKNRIIEEQQEKKAIAEKINGTQLEIMVKTGEKGQLFESISKQKIAEKLQELGHHIEEEQIELKDPIKSLGDFPVKIKFAEDVKAQITLNIKAEE